MTKKGDSWNESELYLDPVTLHRVRRVTRSGLYNQLAPYHTATGWTGDGQQLVFASARDGGSAICKVHVPTGEITQLTEQFPGVGNLDELHTGSGVCLGDGMGVGMMTCVGLNQHWCVYVLGRSLRAVQIDTLEERLLIPSIGDEWIATIPSISPDETHVTLPVISAHPEINAGLRPTKSYMETYSVTGPITRLLQVPMAGGAVEEVYREEGICCGHCPHSLSNPDLVLLDRDFPPRLWAGSDGKTNRIWTFNLKTQQLTELPNQDGTKFQVHAVWTWDGEAVAYHGLSGKGGWYIGLVSKTGQPMREYAFTQAKFYGHVGAMANRPAIILDGNLTNDMILLLYYDKETPRIEMVARHATNWGGLGYQYSHPHPQSDPSGRYIAYNAVDRGRSDVFIVEV